jgi:hypothetical protein
MKTLRRVSRGALIRAITERLQRNEDMSIIRYKTAWNRRDVYYYHKVREERASAQRQLIESIEMGCPVSQRVVSYYMGRGCVLVEEVC